MDKAIQKDRALRLVEHQAGYKPLSEQPRSQLVDDHLAAHYLGMSRGTLSVWRCTGRVKLNYVKVGGRSVRYSCGDLADFIAAGTHAHSDGNTWTLKRRPLPGSRPGGEGKGKIFTVPFYRSLPPLSCCRAWNGCVRPPRQPGRHLAQRPATLVAIGPEA